MSKQAIAFVHAPDRFYSETQNNGVIFMPVWAYTLASHLPEGRYDLTLYDTRFERLDRAAPAHVFLYSGVNQDETSLLAAVAELRRRFPAARHVLGGPIAWSFTQAGKLEALGGFDHIVIGDGEAAIAPLLEAILAGTASERVIRVAGRFDLAAARPMAPALMDATVARYYGAVVEVARGCPFLCEFCDIRILPDNNRAHGKPPSLIVEEIDQLCRLGVRTFLLACDNFIGDLKWAEEVVERLLEWRHKTGFTPVFYTWLTINLYKAPALMRKMRHAGFDTLFIGVESFDANSLLETAKVQNTAAGVVGAVREIQSYGFPVVAGLIFGFDSDDEGCFDRTLDGLLQAGLLSGDPSLLTALPGTPLYRRMSLAGRLRDGKLGLGGHKYHTNIRYLIPRDRIIGGFRRFARRLCDGAYQRQRLQAFFDLLSGGNYIPLPGKSYFDAALALRVIRNNPRAVLLTLSRLWVFFRKPVNGLHLLRAALATARRRDIAGRWGYFMIWLAVWSTVSVKYRDLRPGDFDIESVEGPVAPEQILPVAYEQVEGEPIPAGKSHAQRRETMRSLTSLIERRSSKVSV